MQPEIHPALAVTIMAVIIVPFSFLATFLFGKALQRSYEDWADVHEVGDATAWTALLVFKVAGIALYGYLVYLATIVLF